jgi:hypothetical protein
LIAQPGNYRLVIRSLGFVRRERGDFGMMAKAEMLPTPATFQWESPCNTIPVKKLGNPIGN